MWEGLCFSKGPGGASSLLSWLLVALGGPWLMALHLYGHVASSLMYQIQFPLQHMTLQNRAKLQNLLSESNLASLCKDPGPSYDWAYRLQELRSLGGHCFPTAVMLVC